MEFLKKIQNLTKSNIETESFISKLHYKLSVLLLVFFALCASSSNYLGKPIECTTGQKNVPSDFIRTYCWIHPTFIVESNKNNQIISTNVSYIILIKFNCFNNFEN